MAVPPLERQLAPIPDPPPITEERLQAKGVMVCVLQRDSYNLVHEYYSQEIAAVTNEKI